LKYFYHPESDSTFSSMAPDPRDYEVCCEIDFNQYLDFKRKENKMAVNITSVDEALEDDGLKILVHGPAGVGKTILCATADAPTLIINVEGGLLSLRKFLRDKPKLKKKIRIVTIKTIVDLNDLIDELEANDEPICEWLALDSISEIAEEILKDEKSKNADARAAYGNLTIETMDILKRFRDLPGYNVIMTCKQVREVDGDTEKTRFVPMFPGRRIGPEVPYIFDEVFALRVEEDEEAEEGEDKEYRVLQTKRDVRYEAKDRSGELDMFEPASLKHISSKILGANNADESRLHEQDKEGTDKAKEAEEYIDEKEQEQDEVDEVVGEYFEAEEPQADVDKIVEHDEEAEHDQAVAEETPEG